MDNSKAVATQQDAALIEQVVIGGDLGKLSPADRVRYYMQVCKSLDLNPLTKPFDYIVLNNKLTLYARKDCTDQLRKRDKVSVSGLDTQIIEGVYIVKAQGCIGKRTDMATGVVSIKGLAGEALANAMMKAETKAKRRVTLSICGLGMLDESEADSVPGAQRVDVDMQTGEVKDKSAPSGVDAMPFQTYISDKAVLGRFWSWTKTLDLSEDDVHAALNVTSIKEAQGTVAQVRAAVNAHAQHAQASARVKATSERLFGEEEQAPAEQVGK